MLYFNTVNKPTLELLNKLASDSQLKNFSLAGGTALAMHINHRVSYDLDFFSTQPFNTENLLIELQRFNIEQITTNTKNILQLTIDSVKTDFVYHPYTMLEPNVKFDNITLFSINDISCMKLAAITNRGAKRDFYDLYFILQKIQLSDLIILFKKKYPANELLLLYKSLLYFQDAELEAEPNLIKNSLKWESVKLFIEQEVKKLL